MSRNSNVAVFAYEIWGITRNAFSRKRAGNKKVAKIDARQAGHQVREPDGPRTKSFCWYLVRGRSGSRTSGSVWFGSQTKHELREPDGPRTKSFYWYLVRGPSGSLVRGRSGPGFLSQTDHELGSQTDHELNSFTGSIYVC